MEDVPHPKAEAIALGGECGRYRLNERYECDIVALVQ